ncbi:putative fused malic enzyme oxidoreductase; putative phosphotransacetylase [Candidatus Terasakiella magnetica]|uniref:Putative fused malic enzyme oxidoreductase putative phosphotransacetylase n=1 Tax=Candidatus Terasakiella magnetica TaxID=1867952 RepID=A0A1C3RDB8_9PROT|nr:NADP-dependent malic enzyme [Candidatus Terasakiella magnetica]SCA55255.1 putative fused malic enzyme oxidoreductase; putative phosphotransacetylase [Candidatus Terasakiella magnetica]
MAEEEMKDTEAKFREGALEYHRNPVPGKISVTATKPLANQRDLALAYSPGVAFACEEIVRDENEAANMTARGNLVGVISNGTAVLGLGAIGPLASKPVMEGKGVLFKKFAGIDVFDIEIEERDPHKLVEIIKSLEPTFGGINLEDIKAPECFTVERELKEQCNIPVFHDDQHGTAIIVGAAIKNALRVVGKDIKNVKLVASGAGAAALSCLNVLKHMGLPSENIIVTDIVGVVYKGRTEEMDEFKEIFAQETDLRTLDDAIDGADIFLGLSAPRVLKQDMVKKMGDQPIIFALANPEPEIRPELAKEVRPDCIMATGRSDYPNQVNNVLCFPYIFRGALDVGATTINAEMKMACVEALAELAMAEADERVTKAYGEENLRFGPEYLIPKPFDPRLILNVTLAVAKAAMDSGVATRPIHDFNAYREKLSQFVYRSGMTMKPVFEQAKRNPKKIVYVEGEDERVLRAVQIVVDDGIAKPILIGRREAIENKIETLGLRLKVDQDVEVVEIMRDPRYHNYADYYHRLMGRSGVSPKAALGLVRSRPTIVGSLMLRRGEVDAMVCGTTGRYFKHLQEVTNLIGLRKGQSVLAAMNLLITDNDTLFLCDTYVNYNPSAEELAEITLMAAEEVRRFGITPKVALVSHSNFGNRDSESSIKMRRVRELVLEQDPELEIEGEMHTDAALSEQLRNNIFPNSRLRGSANLLIMPNLDAANISFNLMKMTADGLPVGPILLGADKPAHILSPSATVRAVVNVSAVAVVDAQIHAGEAE